MKTRNFLWGLLASAMLVGCSQNDDAPGAEGGKDTPAYVAVNINFVKDGMSRGVAGGFDEGGASENKVTKAHFFFFNSNGIAYDVSQRTPDGAGGNNGRATNCVSIPINNLGDDELEDSSEADNNVEHDLQPVVVIYTKDGQYPTDMVTVLNLETAPGAFLSKDQLMASLADYANNNVFVMSNSVYMNGSNVYVNSSTLSSSNLKDNETDAKNNAVPVYVERLAAKVTVKLDENSNYIDFGDGNKGCKVIDSKTSVQMKVNIDGAETPVCVKILGWELNTTIDQSYLFKQLGESWKNTDPFSGWNDPGFYRSYWADSYLTGTFTKSFDWDTKVNLNASAYCNENTKSSEKTKVLVKALLCKDDGSVLDLYQWNGKYYSLTGLKEAIATTYASQIFDNNGTSISATAIKLFPGWDRNGDGDIDGDTNDGDGVNTDTDHKSEYYKAYFGLEDYTVWYKDDAKTEPWNADDLVNLFKTIPFAYAWQGGKTYYYTDIQHFGGQTGVVRNHHYNVNIEGVYGLGTPVIGEDGDDPDIPEVVTPEDKQHYIAAQINILSWKVVNNDVTLGQ